ncbi:122_t:CDS:2 [Funneliformis caledonium]|uniref:122_t:CDS:1 n=1 Tax=Funneliformis caledonium TaxID=1117310 RepID=A0A9N9I791_9GLOM|nr:122_t:CDS:2 [Funneliformis caledonium]
MDDFWYDETINTQRKRSIPVPVAIKHNSQIASKEFINELKVHHQFITSEQFENSEHDNTENIINSSENVKVEDISGLSNPISSNQLLCLNDILNAYDGE